MAQPVPPGMQQGKQQSIATLIDKLQRRGRQDASKLTGYQKQLLSLDRATIQSRLTQDATKRRALTNKTTPLSAQQRKQLKLLNTKYNVLRTAPQRGGAAAPAMTGGALPRNQPATPAAGAGQRQGQGRRQSQSWFSRKWRTLGGGVGYRPVPGDDPGNVPVRGRGQGLQMAAVGGGGGGAAAPQTSNLPAAPGRWAQLVAGWRTCSQNPVWYAWAIFCIVLTVLIILGLITWGIYELVNQPKRTPPPPQSIIGASSPPPLPMSMMPSLPASMMPSLPASMMPSLPASMMPSLPASITPSLPASITPSLPASITPSLPASITPMNYRVDMTTTQTLCQTFLGVVSRLVYDYWVATNLNPSSKLGSYIQNTLSVAIVGDPQNVLSTVTPSSSLPNGSSWATQTDVQTEMLQYVQTRWSDMVQVVNAPSGTNTSWASVMGMYSSSCNSPTLTQMQLSNVGYDPTGMNSPPVPAKNPNVPSGGYTVATNTIDFQQFAGGPQGFALYLWANYSTAKGYYFFPAYSFQVKSSSPGLTKFLLPNKASTGMVLPLYIPLFLS